MRFLFFNLVVAMALIYLFGGQRPEIQAAGQKAGQIAGQIKTMATSALSQGHAATQAKTRPEPRPLPAVKKPKPSPKAEPVPTPRPQVMPAMVPPAPRPLVEVRTLAEPEKEPAVQAPAPAAPRPAPEAAKRRAEVLSGGNGALATTPEVPTVEISEDGRLMSATERRRALYRLAEEMELFSAGAALPGTTSQ